MAIIIDFNPIWSELGNRYRRLRHLHKWTQEDMADFGFSVRHYQQLENGRPHTVQTMLRLTVIFGVTPSQLCDGLVDAYLEKIAS